MGSDKTSTMKSGDPAAQALLADRSAVYIVLARGFSQPDETVLDFLRQCDQAGPRGDSDVGTSLAALLASIRDGDLDKLQQAYMRLFDPVNGPFPYESEHKTGHDFAKANILADIMGFYRAFGVEPSGDRADHMAAELEFMHLLTLKEHYAAGKGDQEHATLCREAGQKFFRDHLSLWTEGLLAAMRASLSKDDRDHHLFYEHLMSLLECFISSEKETLP
ncbi:hypothetical protein LCGC14_0615620 [marine sediment metagenome]|uniref:Uncharacterized protein n=1 Tax=marine sediment metagenome TaxID=412755 RepID=A0A0F9RB85_9ZZZZ|nr:hypothetical protein [Phycisphaerae bacterium]HDZ43483.1 hypothetical protein [Phycisphaerae bacterium]